MNIAQLESLLVENPININALIEEQIHELDGSERLFMGISRDIDHMHIDRGFVVPHRAYVLNPNNDFTESLGESHSPYDFTKVGALPVQRIARYSYSDKDYIDVNVSVPPHQQTLYRIHMQASDLIVDGIVKAKFSLARD